VPLVKFVVFPDVLLPTIKFCESAGETIPPRRYKQRNPLRMDLTEIILIIEKETIQASNNRAPANSSSQSLIRLNPAI
jgi:hypothetical protein